jgi:hypothetical protein
MHEVEDAQNTLMVGDRYDGAYTVRAVARTWAASLEKSTRMEDYVSVPAPQY